jgi:cation transport ATPase
MRDKSYDVDWRALIFPELKEFEPSQRERALRQAREEELDTLEWAGILAAVVVASAVVGKLDLQALASGDRFLSTLLSFFAAIPIVGLGAGIFMVRRIRRGLRKRLMTRER